MDEDLRASVRAEAAPHSFSGSAGCPEVHPSAPSREARSRLERLPLVDPELFNEQLLEKHVETIKRHDATAASSFKPPPARKAPPTATPSLFGVTEERRGRPIVRSTVIRTMRSSLSSPRDAHLTTFPGWGGGVCVEDVCQGLGVVLPRPEAVRGGSLRIPHRVNVRADSLGWGQHPLP